MTNAMTKMISTVDEKIFQSKGCPCCGGSNFIGWMQVPERSHAGAGCYQLLRCPSCSHTWLDNRPMPEEMSHYYGANYHRAVSHAGESSNKRWKRQLQVISKFRADGCILDIGCSSGAFLGYLQGGTWKLHGIEPSLITAERARAMTGADIFAGDVEDAIFAPNSFDVITCSDVMEHLYEPREVFRKVSSWLKPGGIFYVFVPNIKSWEARIFRSYWYGLDLPRHLHHFSAESLAGIARSVGLRQVRMVTPPGRYIEQSTWILLDDLASRADVRWTPSDLMAEPGIVWRVLRKAQRLSVGALYSAVASCCGAAPSLQAVFQKNAGSDSEQDRSLGVQDLAKPLKASA
jgi:2-polyprenyl-3-methyl-5-hydroxy-6-metoxy-1,4-benzoquinol methylase